MIDLIPPFNNKLKRAKIEPFIIPPEKLDELKAVLQNPKKGDVEKYSMLRKTGACLVCGELAEYLLKKRMYRMTVIQKYCSEHVPTQK
jgi:hypothetical protein